MQQIYKKLCLILLLGLVLLVASWKFIKPSIVSSQERHVLILRPSLYTNDDLYEDLERSPHDHGQLPSVNLTLANSTQRNQTTYKRFSKPFLYLTETENCLQDHMKPATALGNSTACDVLVLSFKKKCSDTSLPHVTYIFNSSTTWSTGRGELYYAAKHLDKKYLYYIFLDDDVILQSMHTIKPPSSPWRGFEQFLIKYRPLLASTDNSDWGLVNQILDKRRREQCTMNGTDPDYFLAKWFDATMNAFRHDAIEHVFEPIIPHWSRFDRESWWFPQWYLNIMTDVVIHNQAMLTTHFMGTNPIHRPYPKRMHDEKILDYIAEDIRKIIPQKYQKAADPLLKHWKTSYKNILTTLTDTSCHPIPSPRQEMIPFNSL